jgi:prostaglandin-H2 D-isomerase / glutathione transferase
MLKPRLTYFDMAASRGEECRLALFIAGVDFEDNRLSHSAWSALKPTVPFGSLPILEVPGKPALSQSVAILNYVGRSHGLLPSDEWEAARLLSLMCAAEDLRAEIDKSRGIKDEAEVKRRRAELVEGPLRTWGANMEKQIKGPFANGEAISVADIKLYIVLNWFKKGVLDHVPTDVMASFSKLEGVFAAVKAHPKVVEWYSRPPA